MAKYTVWGIGGVVFTFVEGEDNPDPDDPDLALLQTFEASSWDEAMQKYYDWQGWGEYKPYDSAATP